jgi:hypothetical protein
VIIVAIDEPINLHQGGTVAAPVFDHCEAFGAFGSNLTRRLSHGTRQLDQARTERASRSAVSTAVEPADRRSSAATFGSRLGQHLE